MLQITYDVIDYSKNKKPVSVSQIAGSAEQKGNAKILIRAREPEEKGGINNC